MEEKKNSKTTILVILLILSTIAIIIMTFLLYKLNNEKTIETEKVVNLNNKITSLENTIDNLNEKIEDVSSIINTSVKYIEMTEEKYKKYSSGKYRFEIQDMISNNDETVTIKGRVFELIELPTITKEQYQNLLDKKTIDVLGYQMKVNQDEDSSGHDLLIESTGDWMKFYIDKNSDGTGTLSDYTETALYEGTDIYMQIIVDENITTKSGLGNISLKEYLKTWTGNIELKDEEMLPGFNDEFIFENGKCTSIIFTNT